jgi:hypothetical protein
MNSRLEEFSHYHMSYINQIFGDQTVRDIIHEIWCNPGSLVVEDGGTVFENSHHHVYVKAGKKICSVELGYQDLNVDINDTLCQSYSLLTYFGFPFDTTKSAVATTIMKYNKQLTMIEMYRYILANKDFVKAFSDEIVFEDNNKLWTDTTGTKPFYIIEKYKKAAPIIKNIHNVLNMWELYGWSYFVLGGDGKIPT